MVLYYFFFEDSSTMIVMTVAASEASCFHGMIASFFGFAELDALLQK